MLSPVQGGGARRCAGCRTLNHNPSLKAVVRRFGSGLVELRSFRHFRMRRRGDVVRASFGLDRHHGRARQTAITLCRNGRLSARTPVRVLSPDEIERTLVEHGCTWRRNTTKATARISHRPIWPGEISRASICAASRWGWRAWRKEAPVRGLGWVPLGPPGPAECGLGQGNALSVRALVPICLSGPAGRAHGLHKARFAPSASAATTDRSDPARFARDGRPTTLISASLRRHAGSPYGGRPR